MKITTLTGSIYEIDLDNKKVRRIFGNHPPSMRQAKDGMWQTYHGISTPTIGLSLLILWDNGGKCTQTSNVKEIEYDDNDIGWGDVA